MPRRATGQVVAPKKEEHAWAIRFTAYGDRQYITLGTAEQGWNRQRAEAELRHVLADVERGTWQPHEPEPVTPPAAIPTFHEFASEWLAGVTGAAGAHPGGLPLAAHQSPSPPLRRASLGDDHHRRS